jgi:hypothetical protein
MGYNFTRFAPIPLSMPITLNDAAGTVGALVPLLLLAACSTQPLAPSSPGPGSPSAPVAAPPEPPPRPQTAPTTSANPSSNVNLQGFPLPYRQGYTDGCASVGATEQKDAARFRNDGQYRTGWQDGFSLCTKK